VADWQRIVLVTTLKQTKTKKPLEVKLPKSLCRTRKSSIPAIRFESHNLSSYGGLVVFQKLFADLGLSARLGECAPADTRGSRHASFSLLWRLLVVNALLGMRRLRDIDHYRDDPVVLRSLGVQRLPSVPTVSRMLEDCDPESVSKLQARSRDIVLERAANEGFATVTLDFDGSVISTRRRAEGAAAGFNKKKGARSYYPLFCTLAQTGQVLEVLHRSGNVHDSNGSVGFVERCVQAVRAACPRARIEARMDGAFFSEKMVGKLDELGVEYAISVPFERFARLKALVEERKRWSAVAGGERDRSAFEKSWKPERWKRKARFLFVRTENPRQRKGPLQLDLFAPVEYGYDYKCVVTNKRCSLKSAVVFLEGRGAQENVFAELKSQGALGDVPCRRLAANQSYMLCSVMAHNLSRELQMRTFEALRSTTAKRPALWVFEKIQTLRNAFLCKAGRFTRPGGKPTLTLNANPIVEQYMRNYLGTA
jgi:hypothetical protein